MDLPTSERYAHSERNTHNALQYLSDSRITMNLRTFENIISPYLPGVIDGILLVIKALLLPDSPAGSAQSIMNTCRL